MIISCKKDKDRLIVQAKAIYSVDILFFVHTVMVIKDGRITDIGDSSLFDKYRAQIS